MCLDRVDSKWKGLSRKVETGYKVFVLSPPTNQLEFIVFSHHGYKKVPLGKWLTSRLDFVDSLDTRYCAGFHIYKNKPDANFSSERIIKVKYKGVLAKGFQVGREVIVAHHMWVPRQRRSR